jgi:HD-GYP domain-containing protein (c-di-GMP phosphodiesterase class II)
MQKKVKTEDLEIGMYIILNVPWYRHPFVKNEFLIKEEDQIQKLFDSDITGVIVDPERSIVIENRPPARINNYDESKSRAKRPDKFGEAVRGLKLPARENVQALRKPSEDHKKPSSQPERAVKTGPLTVMPDEPEEDFPDTQLPVRERLKAVQKHSEDQRKPSEAQPERAVKPQTAIVVPGESREVIRGETLPTRERLKAVQKHSEDQRQLSEAQPERAIKIPPSIVVPDGLRKAIYDKELPIREKARVVQKHSVTMIRNLLNDPSAENIREVKKGIAEVVDLILSVNDTAYFLLTITSHDFRTYTHSVNVGFLSVVLAKALFKNSTAHNMHELGAGFFLHDLGKVRIDNSILNKGGKLTEEEMELIRQHPDLGYKILLETDQLTDECKKIVMQHHEWFDGTGYPLKLKGDDIHLYGRICSVADVYDALTSDRPYRQKMPPFSALKLMKEQMIEHFQQDLFELFILLFTKI